MAQRKIEVVTPADSAEAAEPSPQVAGEARKHEVVVNQPRPYSPLNTPDGQLIKSQSSPKLSPAVAEAMAKHAAGTPPDPALAPAAVAIPEFLRKPPNAIPAAATPAPQPASPPLPDNVVPIMRQASPPDQQVVVLEPDAPAPPAAQAGRQEVLPPLDDADHLAVVEEDIRKAYGRGGGTPPSGGEPPEDESSSHKKMPKILMWPTVVGVGIGMITLFATGIIPLHPVVHDVMPIPAPQAQVQAPAAPGPTWADMDRLTRHMNELDLKVAQQPQPQSQPLNQQAVVDATLKAIAPTVRQIATDTARQEATAVVQQKLVPVLDRLAELSRAEAALRKRAAVIEEQAIKDAMYALRVRQVLCGQTPTPTGCAKIAVYSSQER